MDTKHHVFLSYSHLDEHLAQELAEKLRNAGITCFLAKEDVVAGEKWQSRIREALRSSERILLLITPRSRSSKWVLIESGAAWALGKEIIPLTLFVDIEEVAAPLADSQSRVIETDAQVQQLLIELSGSRRLSAEGANFTTLTFDDVLAKVQEAVHAMHRDACHPQLIVGSGRGGAICAAIFSSHLDRKPLKVVDCSLRIKTHTRRIDASTLTTEGVKGKSVLVVESTRQEGRVFAQVEQKLRELDAAEIKSFALVLLNSAPTKPDYFGYKMDFIPFPPWAWGAPNPQLSHRPR